MSSPINKKTLEHLAELARIKLNTQEEEKLLQDLQKILEHFEELKTLDTAGVEPMSGGGGLKNIFRDDAAAENTNQRAGIEQFPDKQDDYLKVPPVFE
ncbi:MAG: Asp-tRNA(Asn)/Glu-tRNA(Gln) amidotransferase subunit GatC [Patescibacteria group bacterium]|nr:Asp-tRNA(Asn)/Glu-tRNA(Gln) amidotransferase subunit GatC [Patescibacteria group bacterium]MDE2015010.1 Asp-tRNA(Asn)/Glu-tRNA(Gln) amidotransferase subunit GatC [Patescibacteria group bacterium]MDE2226438.1 Asp-tRNA(Asn)/Glu-tRNA(Gln) amidotransferase subunit GatC [Patescibacteria group bacterium]